MISFFTSSLETFSTLYIQHVVLHVKLWYIYGSEKNRSVEKYSVRFGVKVTIELGLTSKLFV